MVKYHVNQNQIPDLPRRSHERNDMKVYIPKIGPFKGKEGKLISIDYAGCLSGWHTIEIDEVKLLYAGDELEIKDNI